MRKRVRGRERGSERQTETERGEGGREMLTKKMDGATGTGLSVFPAENTT